MAARSLDLPKYRKQLLGLRKRLLEEAGHADPGTHEFERESDMGDGSATFEQERLLALSTELRSKLEEVDHALDKVRQGTYGQCDLCGADIPAERLEILPEASLCVPCKSKARRG